MTQREYSSDASVMERRAGVPTGATPVHTRFELPIYADATLAGLAPLVPVPLLDMWLEERFRRRMARRIAQHRGRQLAPAAAQALDTSGRGLVVALALFMLKLPLRLLLKLVGKLVYVLAVKEATEKLSYYWQRAFLIDRMLQLGHLEDGASARLAQQAMQQTLERVPSPLRSLASQLAQRVWSLHPFRSRTPEAGIAAAAAEQRGLVERQWAAYEGFLLQLASQYDQSYEALRSAE